MDRDTAIELAQEAIKVQNKKFIDGQVKLMLTAFNIECDALISKVKPSNFSRTLEASFSSWCIVS